MAQTREEAQAAIYGIDYSIAALKAQIAAQQETKKARNISLNQLRENKKDRLRKLQNDILKTTIPLQKTRKRESKDRERDNFDYRINHLQAEINRIDQYISEKRTEMAQYNQLKQNIKREFHL